MLLNAQTSCIHYCFNLLHGDAGRYRLRCLHESELAPMLAERREQSFDPNYQASSPAHPCSAALWRERSGHAALHTVVGHAGQCMHEPQHVRWMWSWGLMGHAHLGARVCADGRWIALQAVQAVKCGLELKAAAAGSCPLQPASAGGLLWHLLPSPPLHLSSIFLSKGRLQSGHCALRSATDVRQSLQPLCPATYKKGVWWEEEAKSLLRFGGR